MVASQAQATSTPRDLDLHALGQANGPPGSRLFDADLRTGQRGRHAAELGHLDLEGLSSGLEAQSRRGGVNSAMKGSKTGRGADVEVCETDDGRRGGVVGQRLGAGAPGGREDRDGRD
jgi:hypothetical protein